MTLNIKLSFALTFMLYACSSTPQQQYDDAEVNNNFDVGNQYSADQSARNTADVQNGSQNYNEYATDVGSQPATNYDQGGNYDAGNGYGNTDSGGSINSVNEYAEEEDLLAGSNDGSANLFSPNVVAPQVINQADSLNQSSTEEPYQTTDPEAESVASNTSPNSNNVEANYVGTYEEADFDTTGEVVTSAEGVEPDVLPLTSQLWWVGYDYNRRRRLLKIQILTKGTPLFDFLQERNQVGQPELIIRFYGTDIRRKIRRDIDASEFSSPVAYVRMRSNPELNITDVVLTVREEMRPLLFARNGNVQLTFPLTRKYLGIKDKGEVAAYEAESLEIAQILPEIVVGSDLPKSTKLDKVYIPDPVGKVFNDVDTGARNVVPMPAAGAVQPVDGAGLPPTSFGPNEVLEPEGESGKVGSAEVGAGEVIEGVPLEDGSELQQNDFIDDSELDDVPESALDVDDSASIRVVDFSLMGVAQDDLSQDISEAEPTGNYEAEPTGNYIESDNGNGNLNFNAIDNQNSNDGYDDNLNLTNGMDAESTGATVEAETLSMDDLNGGGTVGDIVGSDSETVEEGFSGKPVVLEFYEAPLGQVLKAFADQIGANFIYPPDVANQKVTIKLKNVPWDGALSALLQTYSLGMAKVTDNVVRIDRLNNLNNFIQSQQRAKNIKLLSQPPKILVIRLGHTQAATMVGKLQAFFRKFPAEALSINADEKTNTLYVEAPPGILARVRTLVARLDVPVPQVEIIWRLIEVSRDAQNFFGMSWAGSFNYDANRGLGFGTLNIPNSFGSTYSVDPGVNSASTVGQSNFAIGSINNLVDLNLRLKLEEAKGTAEILQSSRVLVNDRESAQISAGTIAYIRELASTQEGQVISQQNGAQGGGGANSAVTSVDFRINMNVEPRVSNDGSIQMNLTLTSDAPASATLPGTSFSKSNRSLTTKLRKRSGETAVIGGIYDTKKVTQESGIPFFSSLPIVGALFRARSSSTSQTEMMMLITPRIQTETGDAIAGAEAAPATYEGNDGFNLEQSTNEYENTSSGYNYNNGGGSIGQGYNADNETVADGYNNSGTSSNYNNQGGQNSQYSANNNSLEASVNQSNAEYANYGQSEYSDEENDLNNSEYTDDLGDY